MSHFEKVSYGRWKKDCGFKETTEAELNKIYDEIILPLQATSASAGCDFFAPFNLRLEPGATLRIPTAIRWATDDADKGSVLMIFPRSGLGFKYGVRLSNTVGVIDADYCDSDNEGHIIVSIENPSEEIIDLTTGKPFIQGIVMKYEIPVGAESAEIRNGGFGSTDEK